ncbi:MAG: hypothetical protein H0U45_14515 [Tatlockia sp.]|jgi:hypothetical protein|nr:hypothetical protein [Tatlockia sp.]
MPNFYLHLNASRFQNKLEVCLRKPKDAFFVFAINGKKYNALHRSGRIAKEDGIIPEAIIFLQTTSITK